MEGEKKDTLTLDNHSDHHHHHHVHFDTASLKDDFEAENYVTYQKTGDDITVHLGFLQINHRYMIELKLPTNLFKSSADTIILAPDENSVPNVHCKLIDYTEQHSNEKLPTIGKDYYDIKVEYFAHREKLLKEELKLVNAKNLEELLKLIITARVLGKGKGTPMLRNGIHCIGFEPDETESDASDFQGFSGKT